VGKLQTGRFERLGARTYSIKGPGALVDLDETVLGVILLERQGGMESHLIQDWRTYGMNVSGGPTAAQYTWLGLHNPIGSNHIVVLDKFTRASSSYFRFFRTGGIPPGFAALTPGEGLDTRIGSGTLPVSSTLRLETNIGSFGTMIAAFATPDVIEWPVVLSEDGTFLWRTGLVNEAFEMSMFWAEREAAPFELS